MLIIQDGQVLGAGGSPSGAAGGVFASGSTYPSPAALAPNVVTPANQATADAQGLSALQTLRVPFTAGGGGSADDVSIYSGGTLAPFKFRVLHTLLIVSTAVGGKTVTLRDAASGGGNALSDALSAAATGVVQDAAHTATRTIAAAGSLYIHRSDSGIAGELIVLIRPET
jgi:hypothetical protein